MTTLSCFWAFHTFFFFWLLFTHSATAPQLIADTYTTTTTSFWQIAQPFLPALFQKVGARHSGKCATPPTCWFTLSVCLSVCKPLLASHSCSFPSSYMVMPFVAQDLGHIMKTKRLSDRIVTYLFYQLLRGLKVSASLIIISGLMKTITFS